MRSGGDWKAKFGAKVATAGRGRCDAPGALRPSLGGSGVLPSVGVGPRYGMRDENGGTGVSHPVPQGAGRTRGNTRRTYMFCC